MKKYLTGLTSTGKLTLGNYLGAINNIKLEQESDNDIYLFVADFHALTLPIEPKVLADNIRTNIAIYLAAGIDPKRVKLYRQSEIDGHAELFYLLSTQAYQGELNRMTQFKDKVGKLTKKDRMKGVPLGLYVYPVLMAADILLYNPEFVPVGEDQRQHLELARTLIERINNKYGFTFNLPETVTSETGTKIMALKEPTRKMSKSDTDESNTIFLLDEPEVIMKKIGSSLTDSENKVYFDEENKPGVSNLITIYAAIKGITIKAAEAELKDLDYKEFKEQVSNSIINVLEPLQSKFKSITDEDIRKALDMNKKEIQEVANSNLETIKKGMGL